MRGVGFRPALLITVVLGALSVAAALAPALAAADSGKVAVYLGSREGREPAFADTVVVPDSLDTRRKAHADHGLANIFNTPFVRSAFHTVGKGPEWVGIGDLDGDGIADVAVTDSGIEKVAIFRGVGDGEFDRPLFHRPRRLEPRDGVIRERKLASFKEPLWIPLTP